jgi:hypothetical protein
MAMKKANRSPARRRQALKRLAKRGAASRAPKRIVQGCLSMTAKEEVIAYRDGKMGAASEGRRIDPASPEFAVIAAKYRLA